MTDADLSGLSKIAHMERIRRSAKALFKSCSVSATDFLWPRCTDFGNAGSIRYVSIWQLKFVAAIQADLVCPPIDRKHAAHVAVMTAKGELNHPT